MNWEEAIKLFMDYEATHLADTKKKAEEKATSMGNDVRYLLNQMPDLANKRIEGVTSAIWIDSLRRYMKSNKDYKRNWADLFDWAKYKHLRACLVYAKSNYQCYYCGRDVSSKKVFFHVEHLKPKVSGGTEDLDNLRCVCQFCNLAKGELSENEFIEELKEVCKSVQRKYF